MGTFYGKEILDMAIQIEKNGRAFYEQMGNLVQDPELKEVYDFLANEEQKHIETCDRLKEGLEKDRPDHVMEPEEYTLYLDMFADEHIFKADGSGEKRAKEAEGKLGGLEIGIQFEKDSILFFGEIRQLIRAKEISVIDRLILEEKKHLQKLFDMKKRLVSKSQ